MLIQIRFNVDPRSNECDKLMKRPCHVQTNVTSYSNERDKNHILTNVTSHSLNNSVSRDNGTTLFVNGIQSFWTRDLSSQVHLQQN